MANEVIIRITARDDTAGVRDVIRQGFGVTGAQAGEQFRQGVSAGTKKAADQAAVDGKKAGEEFGNGLDTGLKDAAPKAVGAGKKTGEEFGKGFDDGAKAGAKKSGEDASEEAAKKAKEKNQSAAKDAGNDFGSLLGAGILAGMPLAGAAAGAALVGGFGVGLVALGVTLAARTEQVQAQAKAFGNDLHTTAAEWGQELAQPVTQGLQIIQGGFDQLKPAISTSLGNAAPDIRILSQSVVDLATGAMPGLEAASGRLIPVFNGVDAAAKQIGASTGQAVDVVSQHSVQIGTAIDQVGQVVGSLERTAAPLLGDLADVFAHTGGTLVSTLDTVGSVIDGVAHTALPALGGGIQADLAVIQGLVGALGPASSLLGVFGGTALSAYMNVSLLGKLQGPISSTATSLENAGTKGTFFGDTTTKIAGGLKKVGDGLPIVGVGLALIGTAMDLDSQHANDLADASDKWAAGLEAGGAQAVQVRAQMDAARKANDDYVKSMADLEATQTQGTQTAGQYGDMAGSNARQIADLSQKVDDNKQKAADALAKYNDWAAKMGLTAITAAQLNGTVDILSASTQSASSNTSQLRADMDVLNTAADTADQKIKALSDSLAILGDHGMQKAQDYAAQFGTALDGFSQQIDTAKGSVFGLNGELDTNSAKGRDVLQVLEQSQQSWAGQAQSMADAGQSTAQINATLQTNRDRLAGVLEQAGLTQGQVQALLDTYGLIPANISTNVHADTSSASDAVTSLVQWINGMRAVVHVDTVTGAVQSFGGNSINSRAASASGGVTSFPGAATGMALPGGLRIVGEQGAEVIRDAVGATVVPRSGVDKAITDAMAQGGGQGPPQALQMVFSGDLDTMFASAFMNACRQGKIRIYPQFLAK